MSDSFIELPVISAGPQAQRLGAGVPIIGIDLGTTNSLVAIVENGAPRILKTREGNNLLPSVLHIADNGEQTLGFEAKQKKSEKPKQTIYSVKRLLGRGKKDISDLAHQLPFDLDASDEANIRIRVLGKTFTPMEISSYILRELKLSAEEALRQPVEDAVITVPAYFNDSQRQATRMAGKLAGLNVLRILNEPTAAALAYGLQKKKNGLIAVYDLGGGTFDVSILKLRDGIFEVLSTNGDTQLGGDDIDHRILDWLVKEFRLNPENLDEKKRAVLLIQSEKAKIALSTKDSIEIEIDGKKTILNETKLSELCVDLLVQTRQCMEMALNDAGISTHDLTDIVLVGGPTRLPFIQRYIEVNFGIKPNCSMHPDEVVALGAAIQADILAGNNPDFLLLDVVPLSLGIETFGGGMNKLIPRNTRIPTLAKEQFTTFMEGQTKVAINVYQGERELVAENRKLGEFVLAGIPPLPAGVARVEVTFLVDADGILSVTAKEIYSEIEQTIEVKPSYGLTDAVVEKMLEDAYENNQADMSEKKVIEAKNQAQTIIQATQKALSELGASLAASEANEIKRLIHELEIYMQKNDLEGIQLAYKTLNARTEKVAELLMNLTLETKLKKQSAKDLLKR